MGRSSACGDSFEVETAFGVRQVCFEAEVAARGNAIGHWISDGGWIRLKHSETGEVRAEFASLSYVEANQGVRSGQLWRDSPNIVACAIGNPEPKRFVVGFGYDLPVLEVSSLTGLASLTSATMPVAIALEVHSQYLTTMRAICFDVEGGFRSDGPVPGPIASRMVAGAAYPDLRYRTFPAASIHELRMRGGGDSVLSYELAPADFDSAWEALGV